jgi:glycosyltransferase involved in cell wall biosynthesis
MSHRLILVSNFYPPIVVGGAEIVAHRQAKALQRQNWDVVAFAGMHQTKPNDQGILCVDEHEGIPVYRLALRSLEPDENFIWPLAGRYFRALMSKHRPSWVHFHNVIGLGADLIPLAKSMGARVAVTLHDNWGHCFKNTRLRADASLCTDPEECCLCRPAIRIGDFNVPMRLRRDYVAWCVDHADVLISPSQSLARSYEEAGVEPGRIKIVSNGIDLPNIPPVPRKGRQPVRYLCASYLGEHKGILELLDAVALLWSRRDLRGLWRLSIAGDGHLARQVEERIARETFGEAVEFLGKLSRTDLLECLNGSDAVILPSVWPENEPVILLESIASGAVPIASRVGGNPELIDHGISGLLVERKDPHALANAMARLIECPSLIEEISRVNLARREMFSERQSVERVTDLLDKNYAAPMIRHVPIICAGGEPDIATVMLINVLAKSLPIHLRLIWHAWADTSIWKNAAVFWQWDADAAIADIERAARYGIPCLSRGTDANRRVAEIIPNLDLYGDGVEFVERLYIWVNARLRNGTSTVSNEHRIFRAFNLLRDRRDFHLSTPVVG